MIHYILPKEKIEGHEEKDDAIIDFERCTLQSVSLVPKSRDIHLITITDPKQTISNKLVHRI